MKKSILFLESETTRAIFPVGCCPGTSLVAGHKSTTCPNQIRGGNREVLLTRREKHTGPGHQPFLAPLSIHGDGETSEDLEFRTRKVCPCCRRITNLELTELCRSLGFPKCHLETAHFTCCK